MYVLHYYINDPFLNFSHSMNSLVKNNILSIYLFYSILSDDLNLK